MAYFGLTVLTLMLKVLAAIMMEYPESEIGNRNGSNDYVFTIRNKKSECVLISIMSYSTMHGIGNTVCIVQLLAALCVDFHIFSVNFVKRYWQPKPTIRKLNGFSQMASAVK